MRKNQVIHYMMKWYSIGPIPLNLKDCESIIITSLTVVITKPKFMTIYLTKYEHALSNTTLGINALLSCLPTRKVSFRKVKFLA